MIRRTNKYGLMILLIVLTAAGSALATDYTWNSSGADKNWENAANWSPSTGYPSLPGDKAIFNATSVVDCTLSQAVKIAELKVEAGYTGIITLAPLPPSYPAQTHTIDALNMVSGTLKVQASFSTLGVNVTGGTVDVSSANLTEITCYGNWTVTGAYTVSSGSGGLLNTIIVDQTSMGGDGTINHGTNSAQTVMVKNKTAGQTTTWNSTNTIERLLVETAKGFPLPWSGYSKLKIAFPYILTVNGAISNNGVIEESPDGPPPTGGYIKHTASLLEVDCNSIPTHTPGHLPVIPADESFFVRVIDDDENLRGDMEIRGFLPNALHGITLTKTAPLPAGVPIPLTAGQFQDGSTTFTTLTLTFPLFPTPTDFGFLAGDTIEAKYCDNEDSTDCKTVTFTVGPAYTGAAATTTTITSHNPNPSTAGEAITVNVTVTSGSGTPDGTVKVTDGTGAECTLTLSAGSGSCSLTPTSPGTKTLTAAYAGTLYFSSSSGTALHLVNKGNVTVAITSHTPEPSDPGQPVTVSFTVTVSPSGTPVGIVTVTDGAGASCVAVLPATSCTLTPMVPGTKTLTATYVSTSSGVSSGSGTATHQVKGGATTTTIQSHDPNPAQVGQPITVVVNVTINPPGTGTLVGTVHVSDGTGATCDIALPATSCPLIPATPGTKTITATYSGSIDFGGSSTSVSHLVTSNGSTPLPTLGPSNVLNFPQVALGGGYIAFLGIHNINSYAVDVTAKFWTSMGLSGAFAFPNLLINGTYYPTASHTFTVPPLGYVQLALTSNDPDPFNPPLSGWCQVTATGAIGGAMVYQATIGGTLISQATVGPSPLLRKFIVPVMQLSGATLTALALTNVDTTNNDVTIEFYGPAPAGLAIASQTIMGMLPNQQLANFVSGTPTAFFTSPPVPSTGTLKITSTKNLAATVLYFQGPEFSSGVITPIP